MDKVYRLLDRLSPEQAIEWLTQLTGAGLDFDGLMGLCNAGHCFVYLDVTGTNITDPERGIDLELCSTDARVTGRADWGVSEFGQPYVHTATVECDAWGVYSSQDSGPVLHIAKRFNLKGRRVPFFKPLEVEALAAKLNGTSEQQSTDALESLRQQLEAECASRQAAEERADKIQITAATLAQRLENTEAVYEDLREVYREAQGELQSAREDVARLSAMLAHTREAMNQPVQELEKERAAKQQAEDQLNRIQNIASEQATRLATIEAVYEAIRAEHRDVSNALLSTKKEASHTTTMLERTRSELEQISQQLDTERASRQAAEDREARLKAEAKPSVMLTIGALLELLEAPVERPRPQGMKQAGIKDAILESFTVRGLKGRNLDEIFAAANKAISDAE